MGVSLVSLGTVSATLSPSFGQSTTSGNFLVAWLVSNDGGATSPFTLTSGPGWVQATPGGVAFEWTSIWYKPDCSAGETAPVFAGGGSSYWSMLGEFSGLVTSSPLDSSGGTSAQGDQTQTATNAAADAAGHDLIIFSAMWNGGNAGGTISNTMHDSAGNSVTPNTTSNSGSAGSYYYDFAWGVAGTTGASKDTATGSITAFNGGAAAIASFLAVSTPSVSTASLPYATAGKPYSVTLAATGGTAPYTWSISAGSLPAWASLNTSTGVISGTPTGAWLTDFTVQVTDNTSLTATQALSLDSATSAMSPPLQPVRAKLPPTFGRPGTAGSEAGPGTGNISGPLVQGVRGHGQGCSGNWVVNPDAVAAIGQPQRINTAGTASPVTGAYGYGQAGRQAGDVMVAVVTFTGATSVTATAQNTGTTGWTKLAEIGSAATSLATTAIWYKAIANNEPVPAFTSAISGAGTASCTLYVLRNVDPDRIYDVTGTVAAATTITAQTVTTASRVRYLGEYAIAGFCRERATVVSAVTMTSPFTLDVSNSASATTTGHFGASHLANPPLGLLSATVNYSAVGTTANGTGVIATFLPNGLGSVFYPAVQPVAAKLPQNGDPYVLGRPGLAYSYGTGSASLGGWTSGTGRVMWSPGGPVQNPVPPPPAVSRQFSAPVQAKFPQQPLLRGRSASSAGAPVRNPQAGPVFRQAVHPVAAKLPAPFLKGRVSGSQGAPVRNPHSGPAFIPFFAAVRVKAPVPFLKGRASGHPGAPLRNPGTGPAFRMAAQAIRVRPQNAPRGKTGSSPGSVTPVLPPPASAARQRAFVRAQLLPLRRGTCRTVRFLPLPSTPNAGPRFTQATSPARIRVTLPPRGRTGSGKGGVVQNPVPPVAAAFRPATSPARIRPSLPRKGRAGSSPGAPVRNPHQGSAFRQAVQPARVRPQLPARGRIGSNPGTPPAFIPPVPQPRISAGQPAGIRVIYQHTGRTQATSAPSAYTPPPPVTPAVFRPKTTPAAAILRTLPRRGTCRAIRFYPVPAEPGNGPAFTQAASPARIRPALPPRGRIASSPGGPVTLPPPPPPAVLAPALHVPVRAHLPLPRRGTCRAIRFCPLPANPGTGPAFRQAARPARARIPQPFSKGRVSSSPGTLPPPAPPVPAKIYPAQGPVRIRITLPPRGRISGNPGAPVRNPHPGPVFRQAVHPIRPVIPQNAPRGRASGNPGGPVQNPPTASVTFTYGEPYFEWAYGTPYFEWETGEPHFEWETGTPYTS